jgi:hypothetical protein
MPRSGSTLIEQILLSHEEVDSVNENNYLAQAQQSSGKFVIARSIRVIVCDVTGCNCHAS